MVRFPFGNMMGGKCPSEGMDTFRILLENN